MVSSATWFDPLSSELRQVLVALGGKLSRRHFLKYLGLAGASIGLVGSPFGYAVKDAWAAKSIRFDGWGGSVSEAFKEHAFKPFTKT